MNENTNSNKDIQSIWATCRGLLRSQVSEAVWLTSFRDLLASEISSEKTVLIAPSAVIRDRVMNRYLPMVQAALYEAGAQSTNIQIDVTSEENDNNYIHICWYVKCVKEITIDRRELNSIPYRPMISRITKDNKDYQKIIDIHDL